jgi:hypothetical protein
MTKKCLTCQKELSLENFRYNGRGYSHNCKACIKERPKRYYIEESYYFQLLQKAYPKTYLQIIIRIKNNEY